MKNVEAFWNKTELKIIYFVPMCFIVFDHMVYPDPKFLILKTKKQPNFFLRLEAVFLILCIWNKIIEMKISLRDYNLKNAFNPIVPEVMGVE